MYTDDMCIDYKMKFKVKINKLDKGDYQLGLFINRKCFQSYCRPFYEKYLYVCLIKWNITIGWIAV